MRRLTRELAERFAAIALGHVGREFSEQAGPGADRTGRPGPAARVAPDLLRQLRLALGRAQPLAAGAGAAAVSRYPYPAPVIRAWLDQAFTDANVAGELAFLEQPSARGFERPYGWAWLVMLQAELEAHATTRAGRRRCGRWRMDVRAPLPRLAAEGDLSGSGRHARQLGLRPGAGAPLRTTCGRSRRFAEGVEGGGAVLVRSRRRRAADGGERRGLPLADVYA